jgi:hypothetical protein
MPRNRTNAVTVTGVGSSVTLGDLRWFVEQAQSEPDEQVVRVSVDPGDRRESGEARLNMTLQAPLAQQPRYPFPRD